MPGSRGMSTLAAARFRVGQYNLLCPTYGVKWGEREACVGWKSRDNHGGSNWQRRWPALLRVLKEAPWDLLALEELEDSIRPDVEAGLDALGLRLHWFPHPGRDDALGLAYNPDVFRAAAACSRGYPAASPRATSGRIDFHHHASGRSVRAAVTHQLGGVAEQWHDLMDFVLDGVPDDCTCVLCGDMNEDFGPAATIGQRPEGFATLDRDLSAGELSVSRPAHKLGAEQTSGKGKVDYILVRGPRDGSMSVSLERDGPSRRAMLLSHGPCSETGEWPTDHGLEALSVCVNGAAHGE